jgi:hypothetical protein
MDGTHGRNPRRELLDRVLIIGERHRHAVLTEYQAHYNTAGPHPGIAPVWPVTWPVHHWDGRCGDICSRTPDHITRLSPSAAAVSCGVLGSWPRGPFYATFRDERSDGLCREFLSADSALGRNHDASRGTMGPGHGLSWKPARSDGGDWRSYLVQVPGPRRQRSAAGTGVSDRSAFSLKYRG